MIANTSAFVTAIFPAHWATGALLLIMEDKKTYKKTYKITYKMCENAVLFLDNKA